MTNNKGISPAVVVGAAVVGAAVGAAAVALSDDKNRKAIGKKFNEVKDKVSDMASDAQKNVQGIVNEAGERVDDAKKQVAKKLTE